MHPQMVRTVPRVSEREPFDGARWNMLANWVNGDRALFASLPDVDGASLFGLDPEAKTVSLAGGAVTITASAATFTVPVEFENDITIKGGHALKINNAADDKVGQLALAPDGTMVVGGTTGAFTVNGVFTTTAATTLGDAAADAITINGTATFAAPATFNGAVTLGDAAADALTVNATATFVSPATFNGAVTLGDALADAITINGTTTWVGNSQRIKGDFSNATVTNRTLLQSATVNGITVVGAVPNGTATTAAFVAHNAATPTNAAAIAVLAGATSVSLNSTKSGAGTALPLRLQFDGTTRIELDSTGLGFFAATPVAQPAPAAAAADLATVITLANSLRTGLRNLGLFS